MIDSDSVHLTKNDMKQYIVDRDVLFCHKVTKAQSFTKFNMYNFLLCASLWLCDFVVEEFVF